MSLYDTLKIPTKFLPGTKNRKLAEELSWDIDWRLNQFEEYKISPEGYLLREKYKLRRLPKTKNPRQSKKLIPFDAKPNFIKKTLAWEKVKISKTIKISQWIGDKILIFEIKFKDGKIENVKRKRQPPY